MNRTEPALRPSRALPLLTVALAAALVGCGAAPVPAPVAPEGAADVAAPPPVAPVAAVPSAEVEKCLATANARRAVFSGEPAKITVKHVLVRYAGTKGADAAMTRTREDACLRTLEARDKLREGADFGEIVKAYSDEPGAATREGMVGAIERAHVVKPFADAAFELGANQMSDIVESELGFHVILRTQ